MITCSFYNKIMPKRPLQLLWAFFCPQFLHQFSGIPGSFRTIKRPQFHGTIIGSCRHGWWTRCDETSKVDHFILRRRLDLLYIYTAILGTGGFPWICRGSWRFTQVFWLEGGFSVLRNQTSIGNIMETTLFHDLPGELEVHTSCNWRETPTKHSETTMNHVRVRVCSPFQSYSIFRKQASVREDGLKKLGYPTTNGETLHFDHEKYPWICSDVISQKNKSHLENSEGRERSPEWNCTSFPSEGTLQVRFSTLTTKSRQNTWLILMARNSYRKNSTSHPKTTGNRIRDVLWTPSSFCPFSKTSSKKTGGSGQHFGDSFKESGCSKYTGPQSTWFWGKERPHIDNSQNIWLQECFGRNFEKLFFWKKQDDNGFHWGYPRPTNSWKVKVFRGPFIKMNRLVCHCWWLGDTPKVFNLFTIFFPINQITIPWLPPVYTTKQRMMSPCALGKELYEF